jgi:hypothetical protein
MTHRPGRIFFFIPGLRPIGIRMRWPVKDELAGRAVPLIVIAALDPATPRTSVIHDGMEKTCSPSPLFPVPMGFEPGKLTRKRV